MRTFTSRLRHVERCVAQNSGRAESIPDQALRALSLETIGTLISAHGAGRLSRPLSDAEATGRRAYRTELEREYRSAGCRPPSDWEQIREIRWLIMLIIVSRIPRGERTLLVTASEAMQQGRPLTAEESEVVKLCNSLAEPLCIEAGYASAVEADFESYALA